MVAMLVSSAINARFRTPKVPDAQVSMVIMTRDARG